MGDTVPRKPPSAPSEQPGGDKKRKKLEIPHPPRAPQEPRERYADVRSRAEETHRDLDFQERVVAGKIDFREAREYRKKRQEIFKKPRRLGVYIDPDMLRDVHERARVISRSPKKDRSRLFAETRKSLVQRLRIGQAAAFTELTHQSIPLIDPKSDEALKRLDDAVQENYETLSQVQRLPIAKIIVAQYGLNEDPAVVDAILLDFEKQKADFEHLSREEVIAAMAQQSSRIDDPEKAFAAAMQSSPELRRQYEEYVAVWKSENVAEIYGPQPPEVEGSKAEPLSREQSLFAVRTVEDQGVIFHLGENNLGEIHFGSIVRDVALYSVDGEPRLFIYDENADKGRVGPVDPREVRAALSNIVIDTYFSQKFQEFSTSGTEQDPTKVADAALFGIAHKLLPEMQKGQEELNEDEHHVLDNLARLFVRPDTEYVSIGDKTEFLKRVVDDPALRDEARLFLAKNDFSAPDNRMNMSDFESALQERGHIEDGDVFV